MGHDTAQRILDVAENLVQCRGFNAVSFRDIADRVGIRKASLHYHFPSKTDLGVALVDRYAQRARDHLGDPQADDPRARLEAFFAPFLQLATACDRLCLAGILAAEFGSLPVEVRDAAMRLIGAWEAWLARLLDHGRRAGAFSFSGPPEPLAAMIVAALEGGLITSRTDAASSRMDSIVAALRRQVGSA